MLTSGDGLFNKSNKAAQEYKKESLIEAVKTADLYLELDNRLNNVKKKTMTDLINKIKDVTEINDNDYKINQDSESHAIIEDKKTGIILDITIDENDNVIINASTDGNGGNDGKGGDATESAGTPIAQVVKVGDYVNYNAGTWTQTDINKIKASIGNPTVHSTSEDETTGNATFPNSGGQFGGFEIGYSRNVNATRGSSTTLGTDAHEGWRVWDVNQENGEVTLISAGNPEAFRLISNNNAACVTIIENRDCSMYENNYAKPNTAKFLTGQEVLRWHNQNSSSKWGSIIGQNLNGCGPLGLLQNGQDTYLSFENGFGYFPVISPSSNGIVGSNVATDRMLRVLVTLEPETRVQDGVLGGSEDKPWELLQWSN